MARYAAINLLFTSSPLYPPYLTPELLPSAIDVRLNTIEGWKHVTASERYENPDFFLSEERQLFPEVSMTAHQRDLPFDGKSRRCFEQWLDDVPCFGDRPQYPGGANLFLDNALDLDKVVGGHIDLKGKGHGKDDRTYPAPGVAYATSDDLAPDLLGFADDNWVDGTQSFVFSFISNAVVESGYGLTATQIHEFGHHFGMSHPHDGFDPETGIDYDATGPFYFAWAGDESNSIMSYIDRQLGLQPVRPRQRGTPPGGRLHRQRERDRRADPGSAATRARPAARSGRGGCVDRAGAVGDGRPRLQRDVARRPLGLRVGAPAGPTVRAST